jgi:hypothetical protein
MGRTYSDSFLFQQQNNLFFAGSVFNLIRSPQFCVRLNEKRFN